MVTRLAASRIDRPGTDAAAWRSWPELRRLPAIDPASWPSVAVVAAHPDDEVLGTGLGPVLPPGTVAHFTSGQEVLLR
jgi:hypothetical protein